MAAKLRRLAIFTALVAVMLLAVALLSFSYIDVGITDIVGAGELILATYDLSTVPDSVAADAVSLGKELFGDSRDRYEDFADQLVASYLEVQDKDIMVVFNSGGWGWNVPEDSPGWGSILDGIKSELESMGYNSVVLNYRRTSDTVRGVLKEFGEAATHYPSKAKDLACRVDFLTAHVPHLQVIVAGESNGSVVSDEAMAMLQDNPQVYSIQTGTPFWYRAVPRERTLVLNDNGVVPDTFSHLDVGAILSASFKSMLGLSTEEVPAGTILEHIKAPGHDYSWHYASVCRQITRFLDENFNIKQQEIINYRGS